MIESPVGDLRLVADDGALTAVEYLDPPAGPAVPSRAESRSHQRASGRTAVEPGAPRVDDDWLLREAASQLDAYFARELEQFDLPLRPPGTAFQQRVWLCLQGIRYGEVATYGEVAARLGLTGRGARAVGLANGSNPVPIVIPCHRVVGSGGRLTGYGGGLARQHQLLALEQQTLL